jgi:hypothetical protein
MINENQKDRENQREVMEAILETLRSTAFVGKYFEHKEYPTVLEKEGHDFDIYLWGKHVGIAEVKCRNYDSGFFEKKGYMISHRKLAYLWRMNERGFPAMLAFRTSDQLIYASMIEYLVEHKREWRAADPQMMKTTDHGKRERVHDDKGFTIPLRLFSRMG